MSRSPSLSRFAPALAASILAALLGACRTTSIPPALLSESAVTLDLPIVRQDELYTCGLAAISALCQYWDVQIPPAQSADLAALAKQEKGLSGNELRAALEELGLETFLFRGSLDRAETGLYRHIDAGRPVLVMVGNRSDQHHYCLFLGYDETNRNAVLLDPARGPVLRPLKVFERDWERCQNFTLLACPAGSPEKTSAEAPEAAVPPPQGQ